MSEQIGNDQPIKKDDTQPLKPVKKTPRWRSILISVLGVIVLLGLGGLGGYGSGIGERKAAQSKAINQQLMEQFQYALVDEQFGRYEAAQERLQFIIENDPGFPGAQAELAKVLVMLSIPTATPTPIPTPTADLRGAQALFATAQQLVAAGDWINALAALDQLTTMRTTSSTSTGWSCIIRPWRLEGTSFDVSAAATPGLACASETSRWRMCACACG